MVQSWSQIFSIFDPLLVQILIYVMKYPNISPEGPANYYIPENN